MSSQPNDNDPNWIRKVIAIELLIEEFGICNAVGAVLQAIENLEREMLTGNHEFEGTPHHKNIEHQKQIIEYAMNAVDLDARYGNAEARQIAKERFEDNMKSMGVTA